MVAWRKRTPQGELRGAVDRRVEPPCHGCAFVRLIVGNLSERQIPGDLRDRLLTHPGQLDSTTTDLWPVWRRHLGYLPAETSSPRTRCPSNRGKVTAWYQVVRSLMRDPKLPVM